jgi:hypothetical protein
MKNFKYWDNLHRNEQLEEFSTDRIGLLWLKLKSIIRVELVKGFLDFSGVKINSQKQSDNFSALFELFVNDVEKSHKLLYTDDFNNSWKLKRNIDLLKPTIVSYLDNFKSKRIDDLQVLFEYKGKPHGFRALADVIFVVKYKKN